MPNHYTVFSNGKFTADFRTHTKFGKRLYYAFRPFWWTMHAWDWALADRFIPQLSFGFSTLTAYPDANVETTTVDGWIRNTNASWATCRSGATGDLSDSSSGTSILVKAATGYVISWSIFLFDTSSLTSGATINSATLSIAGSGTDFGENADVGTIHIISSSPASNTNIVDGDFDQRGTTNFGSIAVASFVTTVNTYNDFTLNASGLANISKTSISKFGATHSNDLNNSTPTGANAVQSLFADTAGTTSDPKLVVTYTLPNTGNFFLVM